MTFKSQHDLYLSTCETQIKNSVNAFFMPGSTVSNAAEYSLLNGGKRVRGILTLAVCDLLQGGQYPANSFSAAVEMIHAFSLVHDDLPCMDDDDMRRGKPSCHIAFGEANALLAGDLLSLAAFSTIASADFATPEMVQQAVQVLAFGSGAKGMIYGQELDIAAEHKTLTEEQLQEVHKHKTGSLILSAAELGIIAAGEKPKEHLSIVKYATTLGLVFQIVDDILDVTGDESVLGKPLGSDAKNEKNTFVSINGLEKSIEIANQLTQESVFLLQQTYDEKSSFLSEFALNLVNRVN